MDDVERQIRAWADAAAPDDVVDAVDPQEAMAGRPGRTRVRSVRGRRGAVLAAAAAVALAVGFVGVRALGDDTRQVVAGEPRADTAPAPGPAGEGPPGDDPDEVRVEVLHVGRAGDEPVGSLRSASTDGEVAALWADLVPLDDQAEPTGIGPFPSSQERADRVVVSIVIADDACPPDLQGFRRERTEGRPDRLVPHFVEAATDCETPLIPKRFVVALDWGSTGDRFSVAVDGWNPSDSAPTPGSGAVTEILLDRARPDAVLVDVELDRATAAPGGELSGTVVVSNNSGHPIPVAYCGDVFAVGLENDEVDQQPGFRMCRREGRIEPGVSRFDVSILTTYGWCVGDPVRPGLVACLPDGGVPPLPPGEYRTRLYPPEGLQVDAPPRTVTLT